MRNSFNFLNSNKFLIFYSFLGLLVSFVSQYVFDILPCSYCVLIRLVLVLIFGIGLLNEMLNSQLLKNVVWVLFLAATGLSAYLIAFNFMPSENCAGSFADKFFLATKLDLLIPFAFEPKVLCSKEDIVFKGLSFIYFCTFLFLKFLFKKEHDRELS